MTDPDLPTSSPMPAPDGLPAWAQTTAPPTVPGARWLAAARRWWGVEGAMPAPQGAPQPSGAMAAEADAPAGPAGAAPATGAAASQGLPAGLLERLRRCGAHALRHPGFGFALLRVQIEWTPAALAPPTSGGRGADVGRQVSRRLQLALRPGDGLVPLPRPGAFAAVLDGIASEADLRAVLQHLRHELGAPVLDGHEPRRLAWRLAAVFCAPGLPPRPAEALMQRAEAVLAEVEPGDSVLVTPLELRPDAQRLQQALAGRGLVLGFEPQVDLARAAVTALGARLAWHEAPARALGPGEVGDDDSLAAALLQRQLALAVPPFVQWRAADAARQGCRLALPVAGALVRRAGWADELATQLQDAGLAGADLQLELPPTLPLHDRNLPARLQALAQLRVSLALDDFGTGQSSLSALARLPLALLKIDRGFVPQEHEPEHHRVLLESTVRLATQLGIATLGKGLLTTPQLALLRGLGCQRGEGAAACALLPPRHLAGLPLAA